jgi:hypothetical protein
MHHRMASIAQEIGDGLVGHAGEDRITDNRCRQGEHLGQQRVIGAHRVTMGDRSAGITTRAVSSSPTPIIHPGYRQRLTITAQVGMSSPHTYHWLENLRHVTNTTEPVINRTPNRSSSGGRQRLIERGSLRKGMSQEGDRIEHLDRRSGDLGTPRSIRFGNRAQHLSPTGHPVTRCPIRETPDRERPATTSGQRWCCCH